MERQKYWIDAVKDFPDMTNHIDAEHSSPITMYGDEVAAFRQQVMALHWTPSLHPHKTSSFISRYLITVLPADKYWVVF